MAGRGELAGECLTGEPAVAVPGRLKLWGKVCGKVCATGVCCGGVRGALCTGCSLCRFLGSDCLGVERLR